MKEIFEFIQRDSIFYAKREVALIEEAIIKLKSNVFIGIKIEKFDDELRRELIYKNYLIFYRISADLKQVIILTIHHHSRSLNKNRAFTDED